MEKSTIGLTLGILSILGFSRSWTTIGPIRMGYVLAAMALIGLILAIRDPRPRGVRTAAQVICLIGMIINLLTGLSFTFR